MLPQLVKSLDIHFKTSRTPWTWTTHTFSLQVCSEAQRAYWIWSCVSWPQSIVLLRGRVSAVPAAAESADLCLGSCSNFHLSPRQYRSDSGWYVWDLGWWANYVKKKNRKLLVLKLHLSEEETNFYRRQYPQNLCREFVVFGWFMNLSVAVSWKNKTKVSKAEYEVEALQDDRYTALFFHAVSSTFTGTVDWFKLVNLVSPTARSS